MKFSKPIRLEWTESAVLPSGRFVREVLRRFGEDRCGRVAGALSFTTLRGLVPLTAVAALPLFLIWIYLSWLVILLGAVVTANLSDAGRKDS